ncbi:MAG TPA: ATP-binding protein [Bacteroidales bacterium]|nr:ATP-binding protein [Bacteroidales bacterium]
MKNEIQITPIQKLNDISNRLFPWWSGFNNEILKFQTEENVESYLNGFYMYPIHEFCINSDCEDIPKFVNQRFQILYSAASSSDISVMLTVQSKNGKTKLFLGLKSNKESGNNKEHFAALLNGVIPGKRIEYDETAKMSSMCGGNNFGGIVTGVPTVKIDEESQWINLSSVIRSLYGKDYTLSIISTPLNDQQKQIAFAELISIRDQLHQMAKQTVGQEKSSGTSFSENEQHTTGSSKTSGHNVGTTGGAAGAGIGFLAGGPAGAIVGFMLGNTVNYSHNRSKTETENYTKGTTYTTSQNESQSLSIEQQNGIALELEKIADQYIQRYIKGFNAGLWETTITFVASDKITCDILGGTLLGELSKPSDCLLPPPRYYVDELKPKQHLFIPKNNSSNPIFPKALASYVTSEELSILASTPTESIPGFEIKEMPTLALTDINNGEYVLGNITDHGNTIPDAYVSLSKKDLNKHLFVCGLTGSGKTTTVKYILKNLAQDNIPFLVLESAKRDYRQLLADESFKNMNVFTIGDATVSPIRFNPFYVQNGVHPLVHIDYLKAIFNASFALYGPMPHIIEKCLHRIYVKKGWNLTTGVHSHFIKSNGEVDETKYNKPEHFYFYPTLTDLKLEVESYINHEMDYKGELRDNIKTAILARIESLCVGAKGLMFNTYDFYSLDRLLKQPTVFEMENLADDDDKAFFVGLVLVLISEYKQKDNPAINPGKKDVGLQHFLVIEEAHRLLKNVSTERNSEMMGNPKGKAVEVFCNVIAEMRSLGQGVAVVEQIPSKISPDVIKNSNMKIVHRLVSRDDQSLLAGSLGISDDEALYLNRLRTGHALCHKEGMAKPVECAINDNFSSLAQSDYKIFKMMQQYNSVILHPFEAYEISELLSGKGTKVCIQFLNSLAVSQDIAIKELFEEASNKIHRQLILSNFKHEISKYILSSYLCKEVTRLLTSGIYCVKPKLPDGFLKVLSDSIGNTNISGCMQIKKQLKEIWNVPQVEDFVIDVVLELIKEYVIKTDSKIKEKDIAEYFICQSQTSIQRAILRIKQALPVEVFND